MSIVVRENIEVSDLETEIIEPQHTPHERKRIFAVSNVAHEVELKAWGRPSEEVDWIEKDKKLLAANSADTLVVGPDVYWVKLTGKVITGDSSIVNACLVY